MLYIKQLNAKKWIKGISRPVAHIRLTPKDLCVSRGIQFEYDEGGDGLGDMELALLESHSGCPFGLIRYPQAPKNDYTAVLVNEELDDVTHKLDEIMCDLGLQSSDMHSFDLKRYSFIPYKLIREDQYGNRIQVSEYRCFPDAFYWKEEFEQRGHKQAYSIERVERDRQK